MKLEVDRTAFLNGITYCYGVVRAVKLKDKNDEILISASTDKVTMEMVYGNAMASIEIPATVETPGSLLIDSARLMRTSWSGDLLKIQSIENQLQFKCGRMRGKYDLSANLKTFEALRPVLPTEDKALKFEIDGEALQTAIKMAKYEPSLSHDSNACAMLTITTNKIRVRTTDTYGGAYTEVSANNQGIEEGEKAVFVVGFSILEPAIELFKEKITCLLTSRNITFMENGIVSLIPLSRAVIGNIRKWVKENLSTTPLCLTEVEAKEFIDAVIAVRSMTDPKQEVVVTFYPNEDASKIRMHSKDPRVGELDITIDAKSVVTSFEAGHSQTFAAQAGLLSRFFKCFGTKTNVTIKAYDKVIHLIIDGAEYLFPSSTPVLK